jgi:hypothetical protein
LKINNKKAPGELENSRKDERGIEIGEGGSKSPNFVFV